MHGYGIPIPAVPNIHKILISDQCRKSRTIVNKKSLRKNVDISLFSRFQFNSRLKMFIHK